MAVPATERGGRTNPIIMRLSCVALGYFCGCVLTADLVARRLSGKRVFEIGTKNPGTANIGGQFGIGWAAVTLLGDILKTALPCAACRFLLFPPLGWAAVLYAGLGAALGHAFPFWHGFRGGRSVAVTCAYLVFFSPLWGIAAALAGLCAVFATGYLAPGALLIPCLYMIPIFRNDGTEAGLVTVAGTLLLFLLHLDSLRRIAHGTEKKSGLPDRLKKFFRS